MTSLTYANGSLVLKSRYDPALVAEIKALPSTDRKYNPSDKTWLIAPSHGQRVVELVRQHLGESLVAPTVTLLSKSDTRLFEVKYLGAAKDRGDGSATAYGWCNGGWNLVIPESTLRDWFCADKRPDEETTLYQVLAVKRDADQPTIKQAYRRLSKQWHPDVCSEAGASVIFRRINEAYLLLSDEKKRARYDAGLMLTATLGTQETIDLSFLSYQYRSPLRCGLIMAEGREQLGRFIVSAILAWEDIQDENGRTLSVSWPIGADTFTEVWA